jgi:hypothetical protein
VLWLGRTGRWRLAGEARSGAEVKAERAGQRGQALIEAALRAMVSGAAASREPLTRATLGDLAVTAMGACTRSIQRAAVASASRDGCSPRFSRKAKRSDGHP